MLWAMVFSGAICGLVGMLEVFGLHKRFLTTVSNEFYFDGMLVAMIMRYSPFGVILMSFFFAVLSIGSKSMELSAGVSSELILIVQSIIIFFMAAEGGIRKSLSDRAALRRARAEGRRKGGAADGRCAEYPASAKHPAHRHARGAGGAGLPDDPAREHHQHRH